jgi:putative nucleotidyltransferase with HDIG domain
MRDKETEGHTQRVTILTERLARTMGVEGVDLVNITRGALLHDIGKMAIPDGILLKPGKLTDEERELIKQHPIYAYDMLKHIDFLLPAIDIPYCHHEKWDGTGYPRGLRADEIPFAARIFPIIDVWDALISDRPYRKGWSHQKVREHIRADSGKHFDPQVVDAFFAMGDLSV